jgi:hypothetical protein
MLCLVCSYALAEASPPSPPPDCRPAHEQCGHDDNGDDPSPLPIAQADSNAEALSESNAEADATASIRDIKSSSSSAGYGGESAATSSITYAKQVPNIYLGSPGNTVDCNLIIGFSGARKEGSTAFGIPWPRGWAPTCDIWKASEEAQQNGHIFTSYALQCTIKHLAKRYGKKSCDAFRKKSLIELGIVKPPPVTFMRDGVELLMADVTQEEYEEQQKLNDDRYIEQQMQRESDGKRIKELEREVERAKKVPPTSASPPKDTGAARRAKALAILGALDKEPEDG